jgi:hypothetical protein
MDLVGTLAIPGEIFGEVAIRLGRIEAEALENVDPDLLLLRIGRMPLERGHQLVSTDPKRISTCQVWWLMPVQIKSTSLGCFAPSALAI